MSVDLSRFDGYLQPVLTAMSRLVATAVLVFLWTGFTAAGVVDLSEPGALEALRESNPTHFEKVRQIMPESGVLEALQRSNLDKEVRQIYESCALPNVNVRDVMLGPYLMTFPTKRRLSFVLDDTHYAVFVTSTFPDVQRLQNEIQCLEQQLRVKGTSEPSPK